MEAALAARAETAESPRARVARWTAGYRPAPGRPDEFLGPDGAPRGAWPRLLDRLGALTEPEITARFVAAERHIRDAGISFRIAGDQREHPWPLGCLPLVIEGAEWQALSAGIVQRAELMEAILADVYGPGRLVAEGLLPAAIVAGTPEFLHPLHGVVPPGRPLPEALRRRSRPGPGRALAGAGRPDAGALGPRLGAGEPDGPGPDLPGLLPGPPRRAPAGLLPGVPRWAGAGRRAGRPADLPADLRPLQQHLCRAGGARPLSRPDAGGGRRPRHAGRAPARAHRRGAEARRRPVAADRRRLPRSPGTQPGLAARRARHPRRPAQRLPGDGQHAGLGPRRIGGARPLSRRPRPPAAGRAPAARPSADVVVRRPGGPRPCSGQPRQPDPAPGRHAPARGGARRDPGGSGPGGRARARRGGPARPALRLRRPGGRAALDHAGLGARRGRPLPGAPPLRGPRLRHPDAARLAGHAGRLLPGLGAGGSSTRSRCGSASAPPTSGCSRRSPSPPR